MGATYFAFFAGASGIIGCLLLIIGAKMQKNPNKRMEKAISISLIVLGSIILLPFLFLILVIAI